jgi:hypothetical protein
MSFREKVVSFVDWRIHPGRSADPSAPVSIRDQRVPVRKGFEDKRRFELNVGLSLTSV